jgi:VWFA-related protein
MTGVEKQQRTWFLVKVGFLLVALSVLIEIGDVHGQQQRQERVEQGEGIVELRSDLVSFTVTVSLPGGKALTTLSREEFIVYENGERQEIAHFAATDTPVDIVLLVDDSGSMRDNLDLVKRAAASFVDRMRPQDRAAVVAFGRQVELLADFTSDRELLRRAIDRIPKGSGTAFYDALYLVANELLRNGAARKATIVLSDGVDSASFYDFDQASGILERTGVTAYFIEVDTEDSMIRGLKKDEFTLSPSQLEKYRRAYRPQDPPFRYQRPQFFTRDENVEIARGLYELARAELRRIAERTGGRVFTLRKFEQLGEIYSEIGAELGTLYSLGYYPTNAKHDGTWRSLRVEVKSPGAKAHARSGYWAPSK